MGGLENVTIIAGDVSKSYEVLELYDFGECYTVRKYVCLSL